MILNCIAIDDEPPALQLLNRFITQTPFLSLSGSFSNAVDGLRFLENRKVDLLFLDVQMPDLSGVELARSITENNLVERPSIIFVSASDKFALDGFRLDIVDYILKPFSYKDFLRSANKALNWRELKSKASDSPDSDDDHIYLRVDYQTAKISCEDICYIEGLKDYARLHLISPGKNVLSLITLKALEEKLPKKKFMRIHKSFIISLDKVTAATTNSVSICHRTLPVSPAFKADFENFYNSWR